MMAFTKLILSARLFSFELNLNRTAIRSYSAKAKAPPCDKNEEKPNGDDEGIDPGSGIEVYLIFH